jgi:hypothetical protein
LKFAGSAGNASRSIEQAAHHYLKGFQQIP